MASCAGATLGATAANGFSSLRMKLNGGPAGCRSDEPAWTTLRAVWLPTDLKVGVQTLA
jgi:hypothetical protein